MSIIKLKLILIISCMMIYAGSSYATMIDLTTAGSSNIPGGNTSASSDLFYVEQIDPQSTGTGVIDSFLRVKAKGNNNYEHGFNTSDYTGQPPLDGMGGNFTRALQLFEIPIVSSSADGTSLSGNFYQFLLDINEPGPLDPEGDAQSSRISLNQIQLFQAASDISAYTLTYGIDATQPAQLDLTGAAEIFRLNDGSVALSSGFEIQLDYALNSGSGSGDMFLYVPVGIFDTDPNSYITLYSQFGTPPGEYSSRDGFEEWSVLKGEGEPCIGCVIPEPASLLLLGTGLAGLGIIALRRKKK